MPSYSIGFSIIIHLNIMYSAAGVDMRLPNLFAYLSVNSIMIIQIIFCLLYEFLFHYRGCGGQLFFHPSGFNLVLNSRLLAIGLNKWTILVFELTGLSLYNN